MVETHNVRLRIYPNHELTHGIRDFVYERDEYCDLTEEEKIEQLIDWLVTHGNRCFRLGQKTI